MTTYFISDLHLHVAYQQTSKLFLDFLQNKGQHADAVYILGDFFALWLGDDVEIPKYPQIIHALRNLTTNNIPVYFMHGNRDFLISNKFAEATGCTILPDPYVIELYGQKVLLTHGDQLCTLDYGYQIFRRFVQNSFTKALFLRLPRTLRIKLGLWVKAKANRATARKSPALYDVYLPTVNAWLKKYAVPRIIHGHTHQPVFSDSRVVLGDWTASSAKILACDAQQCSLMDLVGS